MTIPGIARRLVAAYGRDAARDKAWMRHSRWEWNSHLAVSRSVGQLVAASYRAAFWRSVARACTRVPVPARRGATP